MASDRLRTLRTGVAAIIFMLALPAFAVAGTMPARQSQSPQASFKKVFIIVLENTGADDALRQPFLASLLQQGGYLGNFFAVTHPSLPNYIAMTSGGTAGVSGDDPVSLTVRHVGDLLEARNLSWRQYAAGFPGHCFLGATKGRYARKHAPFLNYENVQTDPARCANTVDARQLDKDIVDGSLADYSLYIPNLDEDGHDTSVGFADRWLRKTFAGKFSDSRFMKDMLVVVTFDEDDDRHGNHIYAVLLGDSVSPGSRSDFRYDFYSLLRTIENTLSLGTLGKHDAEAAPIRGIWRSPPIAAPSGEAAPAGAETGISRR